MWTQQQAIELATKVEAICPKYGFHVALTGGCLYKSGPRKDCDLLFYRIRQCPKPDVSGLFTALESLDIIMQRGFGFCFKCLLMPEAKSIDCLFPEEANTPYPENIE